MPRSSHLVRTAAGAAILSCLALIPSGVAAAPGAGASYVPDPASLVNPFIGTTNGGDVFPGADVPFGMMQWSPDTPSRLAGGGYEYTDRSILGYSLTHLSGPGCAADGDVPILPTTGAITSTPSGTTEPLDHTQESATPGYYELDAGGVETQLTTSTRAGLAAFTFPSSSVTGNLLFKLSDSAAPDTATHFQVVSDREISGWVTSGFFCGASNQYTLHFDIAFNRPFTAYGTWANGSAPQPASTSMTARMSAAAKAAARKRVKAQALKAMAAAALPGSAHSRTGRQRMRSTAVPQSPASGADGGYVTFDTSTDPVVEAKVGISYVSTDNATANRTAEIPGWSLTRVRDAAHTAWNRVLSKIAVGGGTATQRTVFYTALYHSLLHPNVASDVNGEYAGFDGQVHTMPAGHAEYANYSGWDIYRGQTQLESMLFPQQASDTVTSMLADHDQTGMLPKWSENNGESYVMVGDPADPIIADAYAFGARGFNAGQALTDMQTEANVQNNIRPGLNDYLTTGYLPSDGQYGCCNFYGPVSTQEEYDAADNAIAVMARALGESAVASTFATQANNWQNVFNPATGFLQPKLSDGVFRSGFDPTSANGFVEGDAYVYTAQLPFDIAGLTTAEGGDTGWIRFL
ncbi:MAG TPA: GH92 family glycosyl hydrolase, partial [Solirubrobacteraceae bacterium]